MAFALYGDSVPDLAKSETSVLYYIIYALMPQKKLTYEQAMQRLETIVQGFEQNTLELDQLTAQLAEAQQLIKMCNDKLQQVETDVKQILNNEQE